MAIAGVCVSVFVAVLSVSLGWRPTNPLAPNLNGVWVLIEGTVDGEEVIGNTITIDTSDGGLSPITGSAICNSFRGETWDALFQTLVGCLSNGGGPEQGEPPDPPGRWLEDGFMQAIRNGPSVKGGRMVFEIDGVRLVYERER